MVDGALERRDEGASNASGFIKKYQKLRKCEPIYYHKRFCKRANSKSIISKKDNVNKLIVQSLGRLNNIGRTTHVVGFRRSILININNLLILSSRFLDARTCNSTIVIVLLC